MTIILAFEFSYRHRDISAGLMSTSGSLEKEDWLDLGDLNNAANFTLDDALNDVIRFIK